MPESARALYDRLFSDPEYNSEGLDAPRFQFALKHLPQDLRGLLVYDVGAGRGLIRKPLEERGAFVVPIDLSNYSDAPTAIVARLGGSWLRTISLGGDAYLCLDVLEHLEEEDLTMALLTLCEESGVHSRVILSVSNNVEEAHLTVKPLDWWRDLFKQYMKIEHEEIHNNGYTLCVAGVPL